MSTLPCGMLGWILDQKKKDADRETGVIRLKSVLNSNASMLMSQF